MNWHYRWTVAAILCIVFLVGCPSLTPVGSGNTSDPGASTGTPSSTGGSSGTGGGTSTSGSTSSTNDLENQFPGCTQPSLADSWRSEVLQLVNDERTARGVDPLTHNQTLEDQAEQYVCEMIFHDFFAHDNPVTGTSLQDRSDEFGYDYSYIGENLAAGQRAPVEVIRDWMLSEGHRANILDTGFTEAGVGVRTGGEYGYYWVLEFGRPR